MERRVFLHLGSAGLLSLINSRCRLPGNSDIPFPYEFVSDMNPGHLLMEGPELAVSEHIKTDFLIVGGGIAGLSAARALQGEDVYICEVSDRLGGTSSAHLHDDHFLCQGAHYDLAYPENYGGEVLKYLKDLNLIRLDQFHKCWTFTDKQYLIPGKREIRCYDDGNYREDVLPDGPEKVKFIETLLPFSGEMKLPTRLIGRRYEDLNQQSFLLWLQDKMELSEKFKNGLDYNLMDDYGAGAEKVSALAGIHYYTCRPYFKQAVDLFSPPEGNYYFVRKFAEGIPQSRLLTHHLAMHLGREKGGVFADVIDVKKRIKRRFHPRKVIFAGQKHALKYIYPEDYPLFVKNEYAPWAVINFVLTKAPPGPVFWQNEIISKNKAVLGFVNSQSQYSDPHTPPVLTAYCCFLPEERQFMADIPQRADTFLSEIVSHLSTYIGEDITPIIQKAYIKLMGHAMPIPVPGHLFDDKNNHRSNESIMYAGVDNARLPLLFEAIDSGLVAAKLALE